MKDLAGRTAFVTGGANGIGLGLARVLLDNGVKVAIADIREDSIEAALASLDLFRIENTFQSIQWIVRSHGSFANRLAELHNIENIRQCGTVVAFEVRDEVTGYTSSIRDVITAYGLEKGVYLRPLGNTVYLMPPYCTSEEEMEKVYEVVLELCTKRL